MKTMDLELTPAELAEFAAMRIIGGNVKVSLLDDVGNVVRSEYVVMVCEGGALYNVKAVHFGTFTKYTRLSGFSVYLPISGKILVEERYPAHGYKHVCIGDAVCFEPYNLCVRIIL